MDFNQLRCFVAVAEELHFGRAARRLDMLPSALGRHVRLLEEVLGTRLFVRTTRNVALSSDGAALLAEARPLLAKSDEIDRMFRNRTRGTSPVLKVGSIDTAAAGLLPKLLQDFRARNADVTVQLLEDKTVKLLPRLLSGRLDIAFVRPPERADRRIDFHHLFHESAVVAVPKNHPLATCKKLTIEGLRDQPLIVPDRRSRPHSHDLTTRLFDAAGLRPKIIQIADEKQTIVNLVSAELGLAIIPRWSSRMAISGVKYVQLSTRDPADLGILPLAAAWLNGTRDAARDALMTTLCDHLSKYVRGA